MSPSSSPRDEFILWFADLLLMTGWKLCSAPLIPRRTTDGGWTHPLGMTFRRPNPSPTFWSRWLYIQLPETDEDYEARQW